MIEEIRKIRRKFARRLAEAHHKGRFLQELRRIGEEGRAWLRDGEPGPKPRNGRKRARASRVRRLP